MVTQRSVRMSVALINPFLKGTRMATASGRQARDDHRNLGNFCHADISWYSKRIKTNWKYCVSRQLPDALPASGAHCPASLPSFPNLSKLHPFGAKYSFLSPGHTEPIFMLKTQNSAKMMFSENDCERLTFHPENELLGASGGDLDLQQSPLSSEPCTAGSSCRLGMKGLNALCCFLSTRESGKAAVRAAEH